MELSEFDVVFKHENEDFILKRWQIVINRYHQEFYKKKVVDFSTKMSHHHVKQFFIFLQKGDVPELVEDQIKVFQLLKEWDCHFLVLISYQSLIQCQPSNIFHEFICHKSEIEKKQTEIINEFRKKESDFMVRIDKLEEKIRKNSIWMLAKPSEKRALRICETNIDFIDFEKEVNQKIAFENFLYANDKEITICYKEFCIDRILLLPKIRPHELEKAVCLSAKYCQSTEFRQKLLKNSNECPVLIYKLYKRGIFGFEEIKPIILGRHSYLLCYYFHKEIEDFDNFIRIRRNEIPEGIDVSFFNNKSDIDQMIEHGFIPSSIEYCLKYDAVNDLHCINISNQMIKWSPFEWSYKPQYLDLLSFSGFFGSVKCFKLLLLEGLNINEKVISMVACSGCYDLFQLCQGHSFLSSNIVCKASMFSHLEFLAFMLENGAEVNPKNIDAECYFLMVFPLILLLNMAI